MPVVTISRELGSGGSEIAQEAAKALGYHLAGKSTIEHVIEKYGYGGQQLTAVEKTYDQSAGFWERHSERGQMAISLLREVTLALAQHGNIVIVGRGGFAALSGYADVLNVRIQAPRELRVERIMDRENAGVLDAEELVQKDDEARAEFVRSVYGVERDAACRFDLVIDTGKIPSQLAVTWLVDAVAGLKDRTDGEALTTSAIWPEPALVSAVSVVLDCSVAH